MPNWKKVIVSGSDAHLKTLNITNDTASSTVFSVDGTSGRLFSVTDELSGSLFAVSDISGIPSFEVFSDDIVNIGTHNSEGIIVSGSAVKFTQVVDTSETKSIMIDDDGVISTRDLGSNAFNSTAFTTNTGTVTSVGTSGTVNGLTLTGGTITSTGTITLGGTLAISDDDWSGTDLAVTNGGTGASNASDARDNLGLTIGTNVQAYDAGLAAIAGLATTDGGFIVGNGSTFVLETGATARTSLGLGSLATVSAITVDDIDSTTLITSVESFEDSDDTKIPTVRAINGAGFGTMSSWTIKEGNGTESTTVSNGETLTIAQGTGIQSEMTSTTSGGTITITNTAPMTGDTFDADGTFASLRAQGTTKGDVGLGNVENTALSTYTGNGGALDNQYITNGAGYITSFTNTMGDGFTVAADTNTATTTITENDTLTIAGGTNISTVSNPDGTITINNGITNNNQLTNGAGYTTNTGDITGVRLDGDTGSVNATTGNFVAVIAGGNAITTSVTDTTVTIDHNDTSTQTSVNNSGNTVIQDVTLDTYGHVTGLASTTLSIPTNNNELTNGAGYITSADGGNADTVDSLHASSFIRSDANDTATGVISFTNTTDSTSVTTGAVKLSGGLAVAKAMTVGTNITASGVIYSADKVQGLESYISRDSYLERGLTFGGLTQTTTSTRGLVIDGSGVTNYRILGDNAFNSTAIPTSISDFGETLSEAFTLSSTNLSEFNNDLASGVTGTGVANRIARWSGTSTISSVSDLTFDGVTLVAGVDGATGGRVRTGDGSVSNPAFSFVGDTDTGFYCSTTNTIAASTGGTQRITINSNGMKINNGALGVSVNASTTDGRIDASNDIVAYSTSDERLKENVKPIENALDKVSKIGGYEFDWKELSEEEVKTIHGNEGHDVGVIAQEIEKVLPEVVTERDSGYKAVKYEKIVPLLIESIKELKAEIEELKGRL